MHAGLKRKCPECGKNELYQDLSGQSSFVYQEPETLGHQARRNTERMGTYEREEKQHSDDNTSKIKKYENKTWYNPDGKDLKNELKHLKTREQKHKYIMEGK
jgi:hypothetical protein